MNMIVDVEEYLESEKQRLLRKYDCKTIGEVIEKLEKTLKKS